MGPFQLNEPEIHIIKHSCVQRSSAADDEIMRCFTGR